MEIRGVDSMGSKYWKRSRDVGRRGGRRRKGTKSDRLSFPSFELAVLSPSLESTVSHQHRSLIGAHLESS